MARSLTARVAAIAFGVELIFAVAIPVAYVLPARDGLAAALVRRPDPAERARGRGNGAVRAVLLRRRASAVLRHTQLASRPDRRAYLALLARARSADPGAAPFGARAA